MYTLRPEQALAVCKDIPIVSDTCAVTTTWEILEAYIPASKSELIARSPGLVSSWLNTDNAISQVLYSGAQWGPANAQ